MFVGSKRLLMSFSRFLIPYFRNDFLGKKITDVAQSLIYGNQRVGTPFTFKKCGTNFYGNP